MFPDLYIKRTFPETCATFLQSKIYVFYKGNRYTIAFLREKKNQINLLSGFVGQKQMTFFSKIICAFLLGNKYSPLVLYSWLHRTVHGYLWAYQNYLTTKQHCLHAKDEGSEWEVQCRDLFCFAIISISNLSHWHQFCNASWTG